MCQEEDEADLKSERGEEEEVSPRRLRRGKRGRIGDERGVKIVLFTHCEDIKY